MDDLISKQAAIEALCRGEGCGNICRRAIERIPSAQRWIPIESRPMDEEERREWSERLGYDIEYDDAVIYTSQLPGNGEDVLVSTKYGRVYIDTFYDDDEGCYFDDNGDMDGIVAWMPLPEPYKEEP